MVAALVCAGSTMRGQQGRYSDAGKVLALERLWGQAAQFRDIKALDTIFDESLLYIHYDGRLMTKAEVLADTRAVSAVDIVVQSAGAFSHGSTVVVTGILRLKGIDHGRPYLHYGRFLDTWVYKEAHWVCITSVTTPMEKAE